MPDELRSILIGTFALTIGALVSLVLTYVRRQNHADEKLRDATVQLFLVCMAFQSLHFVEEFLTGFHIRFPERLGLTPWSAEFFVTYNVVWIAVWLLAAIGMQHGYTIAYFPVWFLGIGSVMNGVAHPALALAAGGYFPGLLTSPFAGIAGLILLGRVVRLTRGRGS